MAERITLERLAERAGIDLGSIEWLEKTIKEDVMAIKELRAEEEVSVYKNIFAKNSNDVQPLYRYLEYLKDEGELEIEKEIVNMDFKCLYKKKQIIKEN